MYRPVPYPVWDEPCNSFSMMLLFCTFYASQSAWLLLCTSANNCFAAKPYVLQGQASIPGLEVSLDIHSMMLLFRTVTPSKGARIAPCFSASMSEYLGLRLTARTRSASAQKLCACMST